MLETVRTFKLGDLADAYAGGAGNRARGRGRRRHDAPPQLVFNGRQLSAYADGLASPRGDESGPEGQTKVLTIRAIDSLTIDEGELATCTMKREAPEDAFTRSGDVVVSLTSPFQVACVDGGHEGIFVTNAFAVIRCSVARSSGAPGAWPLDPWYLAAYLSLAETRGAMRSMASGGKTPMLRLERLEEIEIPLASLAVQDAIGRTARASAACAAGRRRQAELQARLFDRAYASLERTEEPVSDRGLQGEGLPEQIDDCIRESTVLLEAFRASAGALEDLLGGL